MILIKPYQTLSREKTIRKVLAEAAENNPEPNNPNTLILQSKE